jgi:hypothetical protein
MKFIRYELSFFGERQNIGFIQGLKEQGIPDNTIDELIKVFDAELSIPPFHNFTFDRTQEYPASFFTVKGEEKFKDVIRKIITFIESLQNGWEVEKIEMDLNLEDERILYIDEYQAIILMRFHESSY